MSLRGDRTTEHTFNYLSLDDSKHITYGYIVPFEGLEEWNIM